MGSRNSHNTWINFWGAGHSAKWWKGVPHEHGLFVGIQELAKGQAILGMWYEWHVFGHEFTKSSRVLAVVRLELLASLDDFRCVCLRKLGLNNVVY
jgi:hypothetical protein